MASKSSTGLQDFLFSLSVLRFSCHVLNHIFLFTSPTKNWKNNFRLRAYGMSPILKIFCYCLLQFSSVSMSLTQPPFISTGTPIRQDWSIWISPLCILTIFNAYFRSQFVPLFWSRWFSALLQTTSSLFTGLQSRVYPFYGNLLQWLFFISNFKHKCSCFLYTWIYFIICHSF